MSLSIASFIQRGSEVPRVLLPSIFRIFEAWKLTGAQQVKLLGLINEKTLYNWKKGAREGRAIPRSHRTGELHSWHLQGAAGAFSYPIQRRPLANESER